MFKNVSDILGKITPKQRIVALLMVLFTIISVIKGPQLIKSLRKVPTEYLELVDNQNKKILLLSADVMKLNEDVVIQSQECTSKRIKREREISNIVDELISIAQVVSLKPTIVLKTTDTIHTNTTDTIHHRETQQSVGNNDAHELLLGLENLRVNLSNK